MLVSFEGLSARERSPPDGARAGSAGPGAGARFKFRKGTCSSARPRWGEKGTRERPGHCRRGERTPEPRAPTARVTVPLPPFRVLRRPI